MRASLEYSSISHVSLFMEGPTRAHLNSTGKYGLAEGRATLH